MSQPSAFVRGAIMAGLQGHRYDSGNQDSGHHCECGSDSRFDQHDRRYPGEIDPPWRSIDEHQAQEVERALRRAGVIE